MDVVLSFTEYAQAALNVQPVLILSIILRTLIIAGILLFIIKWLGSKGFSQLTTYQLIVILSLGSIVAEPMINHETPIMSMVVVIIIIILVFKLLDYLSAKNRRLEKIINPQVIELVKNGIIDKDGLLKARIGNKEFESFMRLAGIRNINEIEISNLEINGQISFIKKNR
jgi:uncharacterized membrane protein YcaP (DUF421 family)